MQFTEGVFTFIKGHWTAGQVSRKCVVIISLCRFQRLTDAELSYSFLLYVITISANYSKMGKLSRQFRFFMDAGSEP
jgi:hypothetical protein